MGTAWAHAPGAVAAGDLPWSLRPEVLVPLLLLAGLYAAGGARVSRRAGRRLGVRRWVPIAVGLVAVAVALLSPLDGLADTSFSAHMLQHMLLIAVAAPALLLADPFPIMIWALPRRVRLLTRSWIGRGSLAGRLWRTATAMGPAWIASALVVWTWHVPAAYDAALAGRLVHDLQHVSFFLAALLFWWPVVHPAPRLRRAASYPARVVYLVLGAFQTGALGLLLTLAPAALYRSYAGTAGALEDQAWGGVIMWGLGGLVDMLAVLLVVYRSFGSADARTGSTAAWTRVTGASRQ